MRELGVNANRLPTREEIVRKYPHRTVGLETAAVFFALGFPIKRSIPQEKGPPLYVFENSTAMETLLEGIQNARDTLVDVSLGVLSIEDLSGEEQGSTQGY